MAEQRTRGSWWLENDDGEVEAFLRKVEGLADAEGYRRFRDALTSDDLFYALLGASEEGDLSLYLKVDWPEREDVERVISLSDLLSCVVEDAEKGRKSHDDDLDHELRLAAALRRAAERIEAAVDKVRREPPLGAAPGELDEDKNRLWASQG